MLKVNFFVYNLGGYSGAALQALNLAKHLPHDITILNIGEAYTENTQKNVSVVNLPKQQIWRFISIFLRLVFYRPNVIHFHGQFLAAMGLARALSITYVLKTTLMGDDDFDSLRKKRFSNLRLWLSTQSSFNIVLSEQLRSINSKFYPKSNIQIIRNGTHIPEDCPELENKGNLFYFCGVISERKNTLKAIQVFHENYSSLPNAHLYIVGPASNFELNMDFNSEYLSKCIDYIERNKLKEKTTFTGLLPQAEVAKIAAKCKALLFFSNFEGMPNVVIEAMAQNCVPIISSMHGVGHELTQGGVGFVLEDSNTPLIDSINKLILDCKPYHRATNEYSLKTTAKLVAELYKSAGK